jgi:hypothetical protein
MSNEIVQRATQVVDVLPKEHSEHLGQRSSLPENERMELKHLIEISLDPPIISIVDGIHGSGMDLLEVLCSPLKPQVDAIKGAHDPDLELFRAGVPADVTGGDVNSAPCLAPGRRS